MFCVTWITIQSSSKSAGMHFSENRIFQHQGRRERWREKLGRRKLGSLFVKCVMRSRTGTRALFTLPVRYEVACCLSSDTAVVPNSSQPQILHILKSNKFFIKYGKFSRRYLEITELYIFRLRSFCWNAIVDHHAIICKQVLLRSQKQNIFNYLRWIEAEAKKYLPLSYERLWMVKLY